MQTTEREYKKFRAAVNIHKNIKPEVSLNEVLRFLGAKKGMASERTVKKVKTFIEDSGKLLDPVVIESDMRLSKSDNNRIRLSSGVELKSPKLSRTLGDCKTAKVFVATVGKKIEKKINELMDENRFAEAAIMDAIASVAVEDTVETFQTKIDMKLEPESKRTTLRFSPGYCDWDIKEQKKIFKTIDTSSIDVTLSKSSLMSPRKTVSGIFGIGSCEDLSGRTGNPCELCGKKDCIARRSES